MLLLKLVFYCNALQAVKKRGPRIFSDPSVSQEEGQNQYPKRHSWDGNSASLHSRATALRLAYQVDLKAQF